MLPSVSPVGIFTQESYSHVYLCRAHHGGGCGCSGVENSRQEEGQGGLEPDVHRALHLLPFIPGVESPLVKESVLGIERQCRL
jgi:hypothetical protein